MHSDQLLYLIDIAKTNSINATAKRMFSSQQAVSESIKHLENELNCTILNRSKTGVSLTDDGKYVLAHAIDMIAQYNTLLKHFNNASQPLISGKLTLGVAPLATSTLLTELLLKLHNTYPDIILYAQEHSAETILQLIIEGKLDFGLLSFLEGWTEPLATIKENTDVPLHFQKLYKDELVCVMSKNNPLSTEKILSFQDLANVKQTMYTYSNSAISDDSCLHISNNTSIHQKFMMENRTVCLMPYQAYKLLYPKKEFCCIPVVDAQPVTACLVCRKTDYSPSNTLYQTFIDITTSVLQHI